MGIPKQGKMCCNNTGGMSVKFVFAKYCDAGHVENSQLVQASPPHYIGKKAR